MHNFNVIPTTHNYTLVAASNMGGTTVVDFTDPANPTEIGFFDAQLEAGPLVSSPWSTYWYNGFIYANDRGRGVDVLQLSDRARAGTRKRQKAPRQASASGRWSSMAWFRWRRLRL